MVEAGFTDLTTAAGVYAALADARDSAKAQALLLSSASCLADRGSNIPERDCPAPRPDHHQERLQSPKTAVTVSPSSALAKQAQKPDKTYGYCRMVEGWSGRGHVEADCWSKK